MAKTKPCNAERSVERLAGGAIGSCTTHESKESPHDAVVEKVQVVATEVQQASDEDDQRHEDDGSGIVRRAENPDLSTNRKTIVTIRHGDRETLKQT